MRASAKQYCESAAPPTARAYNRPATEAKRLNVSVRTLATWLAEKRIPCRKIGRTVLIDPAESDAALERFRVGPATEPKRRAGRITNG
jgi:excisionase family DNA binding protein